MNTFELYKDIEKRTNGEIYLGVVGPVRTGKSTFIKRFMDLLVLPNMEDAHARARTQDELPQSASGKTIMTTEPKFVPKEAAEIKLGENVKAKVRLIDCVGYMVEGATGHVENDEERQVKTPWFDYEIPFTKAAAIGTRKVIFDHSTIGIIVTTDGSIGQLPRENYRQAEERTIQELKSIGKPFIVLVNTTKPFSEEAKRVVREMEENHSVKAMAVNCEQLREEDVHRIMEKLLLAFPVSEIHFHIPKWIEMLSNTHKVKEELIKYVKQVMDEIEEIGDVKETVLSPSPTYISGVNVEKMSLDSGKVDIGIKVPESYYYEMLSELLGMTIENEYDLIQILKEMSLLKKEYEKVKDAMDSVKRRGYGVVSPTRDEVQLDAPQLVKQGSKFGVKIHSKAPSIHMIRANIETEIAPIVGNEAQATDLVKYIKDAEQTEEGMWGTNIFGKTVEELIMDGMKNKIMMINDESQTKLQDTMQKIVNDSNGGMVCIII